MTRSIAICVVACLVGAFDAQAGENWPGWRGPNRSGVSNARGLPQTWSKTEGVQWTAELPGSGISNPIVWEDRVIVTSSDGPKQDELHIICLNRVNGGKLWHSRLWGTSPTLCHGTKSTMASPSPVTDGQHIYAFFGTGDLFCLDMEGRLAWQRALADEYGEFENRFAASSSPLLFEDTVILQCDHYGQSYALAVDKSTGQNRWKTDRPECWLSWSSPIVAPVMDQNGTTAKSHELILCGSEKVDALDPRTGEKLWTLGGFEHECIPTPLFGHGLILAVSGPNGVTHAIRPGGRGDIAATHVAWSSNKGAPFVPSGILVGDYYYLVNDQGIGTCLDARSGKEVWRKRLGGEYTASPVAADGKIYFTNEAGTTLVLQADTAAYVELAQNDIEEPVYASPAISQGTFFLRAAGKLYAIGAGRAGEE
ncbi:MAG: PQQ-binding-like beta-propeller repeat protein [Pirellulales bacterium]